MEQVRDKITKVLREQREQLHFAYYCSPTTSSGVGVEIDDMIYTNVAYLIMREIGLGEEYLNSMEHD